MGEPLGSDSRGEQQALAFVGEQRSPCNGAVAMDVAWGPGAARTEMGEKRLVRPTPVVLRYFCETVEKRYLAMQKLKR